MTTGRVIEEDRGSAQDAPGSPETAEEADPGIPAPEEAPEAPSSPGPTPAVEGDRSADAPAPPAVTTTVNVGAVPEEAEEKEA